VCSSHGCSVLPAPAVMSPRVLSSPSRAVTSHPAIAQFLLWMPTWAVPTALAESSRHRHIRASRRSPPRPMVAGQAATRCLVAWATRAFWLPWASWLPVSPRAAPAHRAGQPAVPARPARPGGRASGPACSSLPGHRRAKAARAGAVQAVPALAGARAAEVAGVAAPGAAAPAGAPAARKPGPSGRPIRS
jgi:hypothetical protein